MTKKTPVPERVEVVDMPPMEALAIASEHYASFAKNDIETTIKELEERGPEVLARDVVLVEDVIHKFMDIQMALQVQLQSMGYSVSVLPPTKKVELVQ